MLIRKSRSTGAGPSALVRERARPDSRRRGAAAAAPAPRQSRGSAPARGHGAMDTGSAGTLAPLTRELKVLYRRYLSKFH